MDRRPRGRVSRLYLVPGPAVCPAQEQREEIRKGLTHAENLASAFRQVGKVVEPSVVNINVRKKAASAKKMPFDDDMLRRFFPDRNGDGEPDLPDGFSPHGMAPDDLDVPSEIGTGSGVIMEVEGKYGYILTNNHVAGGAEEMLITLSDGREIKNAKVLGADAKTDLAVVRIEADRLVASKWGSSDELQKGDWVLAFGSPFGYVGSMTHGIVSALNRQAGILGQYGYESFIQVDAPINPGNSGGPLVNLKGEVVGINTAIASRNGGFQGIGFAIPSNMARFIYSSLKDKGKVVRGWLGVSIGDVARNQPAAKSFGWDKSEGVLVEEIIAGTPATGKLQRGDIVTEINGKSVDTVQQLRNTIAAMPPGTEVQFKVFRDSKFETVAVKLGEQPADLAMAARKAGGRDNSVKEVTASADALGIHVQTLTGEMADRRGLDVKGGVMITRVDPRSLGFQAGLRVGDVITEVGKQGIAGSDEFLAAIKKQDLKKGVRLYVTTRDGSRFVFIQSDK